MNTANRLAKWLFVLVMILVGCANLYASAGAGQSSFGYAGEYQDPNGLLYLRARYYAPAQGRFFQPDPSQQERNLYQYSYNNPLIDGDQLHLLFGGAYVNPGN